MRDQENQPRPNPDWLPEALKVVHLDMPQEITDPRVGDICPSCRKGILDYDGLLNLGCPQCGYSLGGCFT